METRRLLLAFVLSLAVIAIWYTLFPPAKPKPPEPPPAQSQPAAPAPAPGAPSAPAAPTPAVPGQPVVAAPAAPAPAAAAAEEEITLQSGRTVAVLTNRGAQLLSMMAPEKSDPKSGVLELVRQRVGLDYPYSLTTADGRQPSPLNQALFKAERGADGRSVTFRYSGPLGVAEKTFRFDDRGLLATDVRVPGRADWGLLLGPGVRNPSAKEMESRYEHRRAVYKAGGDYETVDPGSAFDPVEIPGRSLAWVGVQDTYYLAAAVPQGAIDRAILVPMMVETADKGAPRFLPVPGKDQLTSDQKKLPREFFAVLRPAGDHMALVSYWGSKDYDRLKALPYGLDETIELGTLKPLIVPLLIALHWIHDNIVANYGWAIVLLTILIKLLLLPLTHRSTVSMRKMQDLNPKVQAVRDRYRQKLRDKAGKPNLEAQRKMNEEVMGIYKEAGVNPAGGCLPLLIQMPILFAFYRLLSTAVDLRHAPWMLWIQDLSAADPYLALPIIMGVTQLIQVRMGPQAGDPMQRRLFQIMPVAMTFFFLGVPSGLVLYWLTNNVLTIIQLQVYNSLRAREA